MKADLIKLSPLVIATLHGYGAAWLAVKMLFRPHNPYLIFGWQVPLTPGMLPKERAHFIEALSSIIAERLLDEETVARELSKLGLENEITAMAISQAKNEATIQVVVESLRQQLSSLKESPEARVEIVKALRGILEVEMDQRMGLLRRMMTGFFLDEATLHNLVGEALDKLADQLAGSLYARNAIAAAITAIPAAILGGTANTVNLVDNFSSLISRRLDVRSILQNRLNALSNEAIEALIMDTAGGEIRAIIWFGAGIGLCVGIFQTMMNFIW